MTTFIHKSLSCTIPLQGTCRYSRGTGVPQTLGDFRVVVASTTIFTPNVHLPVSSVCIRPRLRRRAVVRRVVSCCSLWYPCHQINQTKSAECGVPVSLVLLCVTNNTTTSTPPRSVLLVLCRFTSSFTFTSYRLLPFQSEPNSESTGLVRITKVKYT